MLELQNGAKVKVTSLPVKVEGAPPSSRLTVEDRKVGGAASAMLEIKTSSKYSPKLSHYSTTAKEVIFEEETLGCNGSSEKLKSLYSPDSPPMKDRNPLHTYSTHREFCIPSSL